ncbi:di-heme oxidoredictase family protein [Psychroserpens sp. NJDZ02]|uniref:di-heme oxidoreductase family protein n=1 Tax=Psychroserpens sp. NJDZ02 TaxID=2570561 RepID=UPI0010A8550B|nr:di-heme oxidoredictase family protein [Psychroserpens sp. NJDZ02]QCE40059.1 c-type cytochrome [Psychroserpens sp. NJDZ02]
MKYKLPLIYLFLLILFNCSDDDNYQPVPDSASNYEEGEELLTGVLGVNSTSSNAFGFEIDGLSFQQLAVFASGNSLFNQTWVSAPASTTARDGIGPTFNARACASCHFKDGRGSPLVNGSNSSGFLMRISLNGQDANGDAIPVPGYGLQLQDQANNGIAYEAKINITHEAVNGTFADGSTYQLQKPIYTFQDEQFGALTGVNTSPRIGQQTIGLGLISALPDIEITKFEDSNDSDNDGISGRANFVYNYDTNAIALGRFGWKANAPTLRQQVAGAFHGDMGLTTSIFSEQNCPSPQQDCFDAPNGGTPEVTDSQLEKVIFYQAHLAVPNRRNYLDADVQQGKVLFNQLNCIACHAINQKTGTDAESELLENITIKPYSDFLLHDMGDALADNRSDFNANGNEWRTQPLWGIGLISTVNNHTNLLHDGRARTIEEAILWHGGEAETSKQNFKNLNAEKRQQLIAFVNSL